MRSRHAVSVAIAVLSSCIAVPAATLAQSEEARAVAAIAQPRPFGHVIGDVITQRILLPRRFEPTDLTAQRVSIWFERRGSRIETTPNGERWLIVDYQVMNAPQTLASVALPAWELVSHDGQKLSVPAWSVSVSAMLPPTASPSSETLRPDRAAPTVPTAATRQRLHAALIALALTCVAWLAWMKRRDVRERANLPFARALHDMSALSDTGPQSWQVLHRAFDQAAGRVIQLETLSVLFQKAPHLEPLHAKIERFFSQSSARFFGEGLQDEPMSSHALCRELRRLEKRYAQ